MLRDVLEEHLGERRIEQLEEDLRVYRYQSGEYRINTDARLLRIDQSVDGRCAYLTGDPWRKVVFLEGQYIDHRLPDDEWLAYNLRHCEYDIVLPSEPRSKVVRVLWEARNDA